MALVCFSQPFYSTKTWAVCIEIFPSESTVNATSLTLQRRWVAPLLSELYLAAPARWGETRRCGCVRTAATFLPVACGLIAWVSDTWAPAVGGAELIGTKQSVTSSEKHGIVVKARRAPWICRSEAERAQAVPGNQRPEAANVVVVRALWWCNCHLKRNLGHGLSASRSMPRLGRCIRSAQAPQGRIRTRRTRSPWGVVVVSLMTISHSELPGCGGSLTCQCDVVVVLAFLACFVWFLQGSWKLGPWWCLGIKGDGRGFAFGSLWWAQLLSIHLCGQSRGLTQLPSDGILGRELPFTYLLLWSEMDAKMWSSSAEQALAGIEQYCQSWWLAFQKVT